MLSPTHSSLQFLCSNSLYRMPAFHGRLRDETMGIHPARATMQTEDRPCRLWGESIIINYQLPIAESELSFGL